MNNETKQRHAANEALNNEVSLRYHDGLPIARIDRILRDNGFNATEPAIWCGREGRVHEQVGSRTWLLVQWHKLENSGRYEVIAYVS